MNQKNNNLQIAIRTQKNFIKEKSVQLQPDIKVYRESDYKKEMPEQKVLDKRAKTLRESFNKTNVSNRFNTSLFDSESKDGNEEIRGKDFELTI